MRKSLFYSRLFAFLALSWASIEAYAQHAELIHPNRDLSVHDMANEEIYAMAIAEVHNTPQSTVNLELNRVHIVSLLHTRYPEMAMVLSDSPEMILSDDEISGLLVQLLEEEAEEGIGSEESKIWEQAEGSIVGQEDLATLEFLYGYELFKNKRIKEAQNRFEHLIKTRKGPYQYALYYSALGDLLQSKFSDAIENLLKIKDEERLSSHLPYYLAAGHYGNKDYATVAKYYELRIHETNLHNIQGIIKLVAYSQFKLQRYTEAENTLQVLASYRALSPEENYVLSTCLTKSGKQNSASEILASIVETEKSNIRIAKNAKYDYALSMADQGQYKTAIEQFESMLSSKDYDPVDLQYNILQLQIKDNNQDGVANYASMLLKSKYKKQAAAILANSIDNVHNRDEYIATINSLRTQVEIHPQLTSSVYKRAVKSLQQKSISDANVYFDLLGSFDPKIEERGAVAAWKGILAFQDGDYNTARRLLNNYLNTNAVTSQSSETDIQLHFNANYFLAYTYFKSKSHKSALGYFSKSLALLPAVQDRTISEDLYTRLGDTYFLLDNYREALSAYASSEELQGSNTAYVLWQQAIIADLENRPYDQLFILENIIANYSSSKYYAPAIFGTANTFFAIGKYDKAAGFYRQLDQEGFPIRMQEEAKIQLGLINVNAGDYANAEGYYREILDSSQDSEIQLRAHKALQEIYTDYTYDTDAYLDLIAEGPSSYDSPAVFKVDSIVFELGWSQYESGNYAQAIDQWQRIITDYTSSTYYGKSIYYTGLSYAKDSLWSDAITAFTKGTKAHHPEWIMKSYNELLEISYSQLDNYKQYLEIMNQYSEQFPDVTFNNTDLIRATKSALQLEDTQNGTNYLLELSNRPEVTNQVKSKFLDQLTSLFIQQEEWNAVVSLLNQNEIKNQITAVPKYYYYSALAHLNTQQLDLAVTDITENYEILLNDPAWLAKSILVLSEVYVLQNEKDSAIAALQALIETKSSVPSTLIQEAQEKLKQLEPQN